MAHVVFLGTGGALTTAERTTTMLAFVGKSSTILVDCGGDVVQRCLAAGLDPLDVTAMFISHKHPDHMSGFPLFVIKLWMHGRSQPIPVFGIDSALDQTKRVYEAFDPDHWKGVPKVNWNETSPAENNLLLENDDWVVTTSPGEHSVPVVGYRFQCKDTGNAICYSCDTEPSESITRLARDCDVLVHEANGDMSGHTSPAHAARVARDAGVGRLVLIHVSRDLTEDKLATARDIFPNTSVAEELQSIEV